MWALKTWCVTKVAHCKNNTINVKITHSGLYTKINISPSINLNMSLYISVSYYSGYSSSVDYISGDNDNDSKPLHQILYTSSALHTYMYTIMLTNWISCLPLSAKSMF